MYARGQLSEMCKNSTFVLLGDETLNHYTIKTEGSCEGIICYNFLKAKSLYLKKRVVNTSEAKLHPVLHFSGDYIEKHIYFFSTFSPEEFYPLGVLLKLLS